MWNITNECKTDAVKWSKNGCQIIFNFEKFDKEFIQTGTFFKTRKLLSFIRQLNIYGFNKVSVYSQYPVKAEDNNETHHYSNKNFIRDQPQLLQKIVRRTHTIIEKERLKRDLELEDLNKTKDSILNITNSNTTNLSKIRYVQTDKKNQIITYYVPISTTKL